MSLKLVKNAHLETDHNANTISIKHYETIIFSVHNGSRIATILKNCSVTSNKQIRYAIEFFKPVEIIETLNAEKWSFSGELTQ
jgi:hypothetical protein